VINHYSTQQASPPQHQSGNIAMRLNTFNRLSEQLAKQENESSLASEFWEGVQGEKGENCDSEFLTNSFLCFNNDMIKYNIQRRISI
jgi:hypothetical protein